MDRPTYVNGRGQIKSCIWGVLGFDISWPNGCFERRVSRISRGVRFNGIMGFKHYGCLIGFLSSILVKNREAKM